MTSGSKCVASRTRRIRIALRLLIVGIVLMGFMPPGPVLAASGVVVATSQLNIRACASLDCPEIGVADLGASVEITGELVNGFYPVRWYGKEGFAFGLYLAKPGQVPWFVEGDVSCHRVAIVFNIGIGNPPTESILNTLIQKNAAATMFPMGWWATTHQDYLRRLDAAGFPIGTHGDQRILMTQQSDNEIRRDLNNSIVAIESVLGRKIDEIYTPYADDVDQRVRSIVSTRGLLPVGWNIAAADYGTGVTEQYVYDRVMNSVYPGAIVEMHLDGPATEQSTARALPRIVNDLRARGYQLVTVPDMVKPCSATPTPQRTGTVSNTGGTTLRCRVAPSLNAAIITSLTAGSKVTVRAASFNGWTPVTCGGRNGWVSSDYLTVSPLPTPSPPVTPTPVPTRPPTTPTPTPVTPTTTPTSTAIPIRYGTVINTGGVALNCRAQPSTSATIITTLAAGSRVELRGTQSSGWQPVRCGNRDGWVSTDYLTVANPSLPTPIPTSTPNPGNGMAGAVTNTGGLGLNCRATPSTSGTIIGSLGAGSSVELRGSSSNGWYPVRCGGQNGWASADYISVAGR